MGIMLDTGKRKAKNHKIENNMSIPTNYKGSFYKKDDVGWGELARKGEVTYCKKCGKRIWRFWKAKSNMVNPMILCGPCYFG